VASFERITYETTPHAVWITLARPAELNLVDDDLFAELGEAFLRAGRDDKRSVVVLRGSGKLFSGGGNLRSDIAQAAREGFSEELIADMYRHVHAEYPVFRAIEDCPKTTIAALNGSAYGAAVDLVMMCDLVIAVRDAVISFAPGKWGLCDAPNAGRLGQRIGMGRAKDLLFTAREISAEEGEGIGLVNRLCERSSFDDEVLQYVADVLETAPTARRLMKQVMHRTLPAFSPDEHFQTAVGSEFQAGVRAFSEKRPAPWTAAEVARQALRPSPTPMSATSDGNGRRASHKPATWDLARFQCDPPVPEAEDPGKWRVWRVARTDEIDVIYFNVHQRTRTGAHTHPDANHYTLILEGEALVWMEGTMVHLEPGDVVNIPIGVLHDFGAGAAGECWGLDLTNPPWDPALMQYQLDRQREIDAAFEQAYASNGPATGEAKGEQWPISSSERR
jgi:enoyl-CoA hydratase/carnithine racemase/quercetin dioxygenase-like cupin family protein